MAKCKECEAEVEKVCDKCEKCDGHCGCGKEETADAGEEASTETESTDEEASKDESEKKTE